MAGIKGKVLKSPVTAWTLDWNSTSFSEHYRASRFKFYQKYIQTLPAELDAGRFTLEVLVNRVWESLAIDVVRLKFFGTLNDHQSAVNRFESVCEDALSWPRFPTTLRLRVQLTSLVVLLPKWFLSLAIRAAKLLRAPNILWRVALDLDRIRMRQS